YTYVLKDNILNATPSATFADDVGTFITVTGISGATSAPAEFVVRIVDDSPLASDDSGGTVTEDTGVTLSGNVLANDAQGADTAATLTQEFVGWTADGQDNTAALAGLNTYGTLTQNADGGWSY